MKILMAEHTSFDSVCRVGCHHLAEGLARKGHEVIYLSAYLTPLHLPYLLTSRRADITARFSNWLSNGRMEKEGVFTYVPFSMYPYARKFGLDQTWIAERQFQRTIPHLKRKVTGKFDALLIGDPRFVPLIDQVDARVKVLRLTDDVLSMESTPRTVAGLIGKGLLKCDSVIVTAKNLCRLLEERYGYKDAIYMPNGVDLDHFLSKKVEEPTDLANIPEPRLIYAGSMDNRIDLSLVEHCAAKLSSVSFVFVGPNHLPLGSLKKHPNIHLLGPRLYRQLPAYFSHSQAAMIPFQKNDRTDSMCSIKLLQYLASELPTVSTRLCELESQQAPVYLADRPEEFAAAIVSALAERKGGEQYRTFASRFSWDRNVESLETLIQNAAHS